MIKPKGVFGLREQSESESEPRDEEPVQQLADSSDHKEYSALSPLGGTTLDEEDPFKPISEPIVVDPPSPPPVKPEEEGNAPPEPPDPDIRLRSRWSTSIGRIQRRAHCLLHIDLGRRFSNKKHQNDFQNDAPGIMELN